MGLFKAIAVAVGLSGLVTPAVTPTQIIDAIEPWVLACAVGAENGSIGANIGFDMWFRLSRENWIPKLRTTVPVSDKEIESALRDFVKTNRTKDYKVVLREQETKRGLDHALVLGPGESMTMSVPITQSR